MVTFLIYQFFSNSALYKHKGLEIINRLYTSDGKVYSKHQHKSILESEMASTPEGFTDNSQISPGSSVTVKKFSASKSICQFT